MNALSNKVQSAKYNLKIEQKKKERQEWLASMSDEERERYYAEEEKKSRRGRKALAQFLTLTSRFNGPYTMKGGNPTSKRVKREDAESEKNDG